MKASTAAVATLGATAAVFVAALVQGAGDNPIGAALSLAVPAEYQDLIEKAGNTCPEVSPNLLAALLTQESGFNPKATSPVGAQGIAQFMPSTWEKHGIDGNDDGERDVFDPKDAIPSSAKYLCTIAEDVKVVPGDKQANMLAAYNAGSGAVKKYGGIPPYKETENYVRSITALSRKNPGGGGTVSGNQGVTAVNAAAEMTGTPYSWGGGDANGPSTGTCCSPKGRSGRSITGFDCSGLTLYAYAKAGVSLPRTAAQQYAASEPVKRDQAKPGDLVFYGSSASGIHHVGIYVGGGHMIDAPRPGTEVRFSPLDSMSDLYGFARPVSSNNKEI
ncbi:bifunctional lytic transglycosylase/C40 family peptidase [Streptomyces violaceochromogenes]|uniref:Bifunctional lytic transglycosylase/C40 family peptidase n=1 Tax=Streptomyces violaceochromogenes TaxID=67377 RepID=A0ABU6LQJ7_9ACTN|nr:bifunctional lytic transglycosylase/C40 family peptidase [Streptomyces violaceochromogenes]MEC7051383.1 bifunctional lytic transglycosylase/C40 family peptidase [Streptomyces violaceochromogenes]GHC94176.1 transglycosylase [Streptomyces violaceochromogenes]